MTEEIEVTPEMIEAGAEMLCDGSELGDMFSPSTAIYFAEKVIRAAIAASSAWQPIETIQEAVLPLRAEYFEGLFWLDWADDMVSRNEPMPNDVEHRLFKGKYRCWSSVFKATHWMPLPEPPK